MPFDKDVRFTEKKSDEGWKDQVAKDKGGILPPPPRSPQEPEKTSLPQTSPAFMGLLNSLAYQVLFNLGEIQGPAGTPAESDLPAAREIIDLLQALKTKCQGNLSSEESQVFETVLPELQMKFVQRS